VKLDFSASFQPFHFGNNPNKKEAHKTKDAINVLLRKKEELELQTNVVILLFIYSLDYLSMN
jgi:hypothetical protein